jgi:hypothetical protein
VEVSVRDQLALLDEHERVVRRRIHLDGDRLLRVAQKITARAVHLGGAPQRIGVLNLVAPAVGLDDRRPLDQPNDVRGRFALPAKRAESVDLRQEADARALERLDRQGAGDVRRLHQSARAHER